MLNPNLIQKKLQDYITYTKNLIISLAEDFQTEKIHHRRITPMLDRLLSRENEEFLSFFNGEKNKSWQLLQLMHQQGEIFKEGKGYYSLLPMRVIQFPNEETNVLVSGYDLMTDNSFYGLAQLHLHPKNYPILKLDDYAFRPAISEILPIVKNRLVPLNLDNFEVLRFSSGSQLKASTVTHIKEGEWFIAIHETLYKSKDVYIAIKRENTIYGSYIYKANYRRICFALYDFYGVDKHYTVKPLKKGLIEICFNRLLPTEEISLLNLIALPICSENPKKFITHERQLGNVRAVVEKLNLKELR